MPNGVGRSDDFIMLDIGHEYLLIDENSAFDEEKMQRKLAVHEEDAKRKERAHNLASAASAPIF